MSAQEFLQLYGLLTMYLPYNFCHFDNVIKFTSNKQNLLNERDCNLFFTVAVLPMNNRESHIYIPIAGKGDRKKHLGATEINFRLFSTFNPFWLAGMSTDNVSV